MRTWCLPADWQLISYSILFQNPSTSPTRTWPRWRTSRTERVSIPCFTGISYPGAFIWCRRWSSASCSTCAKKDCQRYSETCRPILGRHTDGIPRRPSALHPALDLRPYTYSLLHGIRGIKILAKACIYLFFGLIAFRAALWRRDALHRPGKPSHEDAGYRAANFVAQYQQTRNLYGLIVSIIKTLPCAPMVLVMVLGTMISFLCLFVWSHHIDGFLL